jgi:phosphohistidine swiveling domain-containing protein
MSTWNADILHELEQTVLKLETLKRDVQDVEFTVQDGVLYVLQTRNAKRSGPAAIRIAHDMYEEGLIDAKTAVSRVTGKDLDKAALPKIDPGFDKPEWAKGIPACSGVVKGRMVFSSADAVSAKDPVILVTEETTPDDIEGMHHAVGVLTMTGGYTSHAAVVARGMDKPCVVALGRPLSDLKNLSGQPLTMDASTGRIWFEDVPVSSGDLKLVLKHKQLMRSALGFSPVITEAPEEHLECAWLLVGPLILEPKTAVSVIRACAAKVKTLFVDLMTLTPDQKALLNVMGLCVEDEKDFASQLIAQTAIVPLPTVTLVGIAVDGFKTLASVHNLDELILAEGWAFGSPETDLTPAMAKVLAWKKSEGLKFISLGKLSASGQSFLTHEQACRVGAG